VEALFHIIAYIYNEQTLPWIENVPSEIEFADLSEYILIRRYKSYDYFSNLIANIFPESIKEAFQYVRSLKFAEEPNYDKISCLIS